MSAAKEARTAYEEALTAMKKWSNTNERRMQAGETVVQLAQQGPAAEQERIQAAGAYQQLCEMEMLFGGLAIVALAKAQNNIMLAYDELAPQPLLSESGGTTTV